MTQQPEESTLRDSLATGALILTIFLVLNFAVRPLVTWFIPAKVSYLRWGLVSFFEIAGSLAAVMAISRTGPVGALRRVRLASSFPKGLAFGFLITLPMLLAFALTGPVKENPDFLHLIFGSGVAPLNEEILFRGFAFLMLYRYARWNFWLAVLIPAVLFGYGHLYQAGGFLEATGIFAITAIGSVWFSWLLIRWDNLWVPIMLHALMNLWWDLFAVDETALGGWLANGSRILVIVISVVVTIYAAGRLRGAEEANLEGS